MKITHTPRPSVMAVIILSIAMLFLGNVSSQAYTITNLQAEYHRGQVFLTWTNPNATNLQYNIYRSTTEFTSSSQLTSAKYLGFVRDNSSQNIFWTQQSDNVPVYYRITDGGAPLAANKGLYVVTCTNNQDYYYAVTVTKLSGNTEDKTIIAGETTLSTPINETVSQPKPVYQYSIQAKNGEMKELYVQYVNNQETALYPAMTNTGSYGFNFFIVKRGNATKYPLFILFEGFGADAGKSISIDESYTDCYVMGVFDWLPIPADNGKIGDNSYFCGYHENFNMYSNNNPIPTSGIIKTYSQKRYWEGISWLESEVPIDETRIYLKGTSASGFGALLMASMEPEKIAAVYGIVEPNSTSAANNLYKQMWGEGSSKLKTDVVKWNTSEILAFTDLKDIQKMINYNKLRSMPLIFDVHGKNDASVIWNDGKIKWFDSLENNHIGGAWYWDRRDHGENNKDFTTEETAPNFYRYATDISYPAFSGCSINQDPGNGNKSNGAPYGAINGYLDWDDNSISDNICNYYITLFIKDLYVGGILDGEQYLTSITDVTFRRLQNFDPPLGSTIKWTNFDNVSNLKVQSGSIVYNGGLITLPNVIVNKTANRIKLKIVNCSQRVSDDMDDENPESSVYFAKSANGYTLHYELPKDEAIQVLVYDLLGRMVTQQKSMVSAGSGTMEITAPGNGMFLVQIKGESFSQAEKLLF